MYSTYIATIHACMAMPSIVRTCMFAFWHRAKPLHANCGYTARTSHKVKLVNFSIIRNYKNFIDYIHVIHVCIYVYATYSDFKDEAKAIKFWHALRIPVSFLV